MKAKVARMSPSQRYSALNAATPVAAIVFGVAAMTVSQWFAVPFMLVPATLSRLAQRIVCPSCGKPVGWEHEYVVRGLDTKRWKWLASVICSDCGYDLSVRRDE
jgi:hypothetical protein